MPPGTVLKNTSHATPGPGMVFYAWRGTGFAGIAAVTLYTCEICIPGRVRASTGLRLVKHHRELRKGGKITSSASLIVQT